MGKIVLKVIAGLLAIGVLLIGLLAIAVPPLVNSDEFHATLRDSVSDALGTPVEWVSLELRIFPLRLMVRDPVLLAATGNPEEARLTAESVDLRLALRPLLVGRIQVESLALRGVDLVVTRTPDGFILPVSMNGTDSSEPDGDEDAASDEGSTDESPNLGIRRIVISDSRVLFRDRTSSQPVEWGLEGLEFEAKAARATGELVVDLSADLHLDSTRLGRVRTSGPVTLAGRYDLEFEIEKILLAKIQPANADASVRGTLSGQISLTGEISTLSKIGLDLRIENLGVRGPDLDLMSGGEAKIVGTVTLEEGGGIGVEVGLVLADGARLDVEGATTGAATLDLRFKVESFDLALLHPLLPDPAMELAGRATGDGSWSAEASSPDVIRLDLSVTEGLVRTPDYLVEGPFEVRLEVKDPLSMRPHGHVDLDLTAARLDYDGQFKKPVGMRAEMTTHFETDDAGEIKYESSIRFRDINEILLQGAIGDSISVALTASNVDLGGWSEVLPALAPFHLDGLVSFDALGVELSDEVPNRFSGRLELQGVGFNLAGAERIEIRGAIVAVGERIRVEGVRLRTGAMTVSIDGMVENPFDTARFDLSVKSIGPAEVNDLLSAFTSNSDMLFGPLEFAGEFRGGASSEADLYHTIVGNLEFSIGKGGGGRLRGVSILKTILDELPLLGGAALLTSPFRSGKSVDDYFTDRFEVLEGDFEIADEKVNAKTLRIVYEGYDVSLSGLIRLRDLEIDMTGELLLKDDFVSAIGGLAGAKISNREPIRIPLARVTNTLIDPKIEMTAETLVAIPKLILRGTGLDTVVIGVGKSLGRLLGGAEE